MKELQHLNKYFKKYKTQLLVGILITAISKLFIVFVPKLIGNTIDVIDTYLKNPEGDLAVFKGDLLQNILLIIGTAVVTGILTFLCDRQ